MEGADSGFHVVSLCLFSAYCKVLQLCVPGEMNYIGYIISIQLKQTL